MYGAIPPRCESARPSRGLWLGLVVVVACAGSAMLYLFKPGESGVYPSCMFHRLTGWNCPGCGGLRALHHLLHGRLGEAFHSNPLLILLLPMAGWHTARSGYLALRGHPAAVTIAPGWIYAGLAIAAGFAVLRNFPQFAWMGP